MTVNELRTYLKDFPDEWDVNILVPIRQGGGKIKPGIHPIINPNSMGKNSETYISGAEFYVIRGPQIFLEIDG